MSGCGVSEVVEQVDEVVEYVEKLQLVTAAI